MTRATPLGGEVAQVRSPRPVHNHWCCDPELKPPGPIVQGEDQAPSRQCLDRVDICLSVKRVGALRGEKLDRDGAWSGVLDEYFSRHDCILVCSTQDLFCLRRGSGLRIGNEASLEVLRSDWSFLLRRRLITQQSLNVAAVLMRRSPEKCQQILDWARLEDEALTPDWSIVSYELFGEVCSSTGVSHQDLCAFVTQLDVHPARVTQEATCLFYEALRREISLWEKFEISHENAFPSRCNAEIVRL